MKRREWIIIIIPYATPTSLSLVELSETREEKAGILLEIEVEVRKNEMKKT